MASRMKRIFSRKKHDSRSPSPESELARGNPAFRSSLYDTTTAGMEPHTGEYPIRGHDGSETVQNAKSRRSSFRSRRSSGSLHRPPHRSITPDQYRTQRSMDMSHPPPPSDIAIANMYPHHPQSSSTPKKRWSRSNLPEAFSNLNIGKEGSLLIDNRILKVVADWLQVSLQQHRQSIPSQAQVDQTLPL